MSFDAKWLTRDLWTLLEAAQICAGIEPFGGGPSTDNPHTVLGQISDENLRNVVGELYARSKDAVDVGGLAQSGSRTKTYGNIRVRPFTYFLWAIDNGLQVSSLVKFPSGPVPPETRYLETEMGYTIDGVVRELSERYGVNESAMRAQVRAAIRANVLRLVNPETGMPYVSPPVDPRDWSDRLRVADLNEWFQKNGAPYLLSSKLAPPPSAAKLNEAKPSQSVPAAQMGSANPKPVKRAVLLERLGVKYPLLANALRTNEREFVACRVPVGHSPGGKRGYYYEDRVLAVCKGRWASGTARGVAAPLPGIASGSWGMKNGKRFSGAK